MPELFTAWCTMQNQENSATGWCVMMGELATQHTCDEEAALAVEVEQRLPPQALPVLDHVGFVQDQVLPLLPPEHLCILHCAYHVKTCEVHSSDGR